MTEYKDEASRTDAAKAAANDAAAKARQQADAARAKAEELKARATQGEAQDKAKAVANDAVDKARQAAEQAATKAGETIHNNRDKIDAGIDKAAHLVDEKTQGKATQLIEKVKQAVAKVLDGAEGRRSAGTKVEDAAQDVADRADRAATTVSDKLDGDNRF